MVTQLQRVVMSVRQQVQAWGALRRRSQQSIGRTEGKGSWGDCRLSSKADCKTGWELGAAGLWRPVGLAEEAGFSLGLVGMGRALS